MTTLVQLRDLPAAMKAAGFSSGSSFGSATYAPTLQLLDPLDGGRSRIVGPSGTIAGVIARTDAAIGVWKAPAGIEATLAGVQISLKVDDAANGLLNSAGINVLRNFPNHRPLCWGARTMAGADEFGSDWKYISVRRLVDLIERSLSQSLKWVVFEPNDAALWSRIRMEINVVLQGLFVAGAFSGATPGAAFFVQCDATTTSQADVQQGIVRIVVGVAPTRPAEFLIIRIEQATAQPT
ncbi:hypothetical protein KZX46_13095 [Polymorphobacter sp. PAMC 29334]|uniref:phage tail sheath family protein n=1 Tax=Polymorphobacter sp. PAMC 29334 TaxID=2862331 RepID=UPI001C78B410|nr:phage tail sheath C-terminal domain-containing protein [Polymorphobacter sp. PAMC 29334]QYE33773.1 hypothetical protein KZX46_13095 [Polymorphobacter sp. PAMC 29334]